MFQPINLNVRKPSNPNRSERARLQNVCTINEQARRSGGSKLPGLFRHPVATLREKQN